MTLDLEPVALKIHIEFESESSSKRYVEWSLHNPRDGVYRWTGIADLERFLRLAVDADLLVILRPGPYICAERDMGGFPYWLLSKFPNIQLRTADISKMRQGLPN